MSKKSKKGDSKKDDRKKRKKSAKKSGKGRAAALGELRRDIDKVDRDMLHLLRRRAKLVGKVGALKQSADMAVHQPGREARLLRDLARRHKGDFPVEAVTRIWREIMGASVQMQMDYPVAIPARAEWLELLARSHFGAAAEIIVSKNPVGAVADGRAGAAVLPRAGGGGASLWWRKLITDDRQDIAVCWKLPFDGEGARNAYVVAQAQTARTGDDVSWVAAHLAADAPAPDGTRQIAKSGRLRLLELDGYFTHKEARAALSGAEAVYWLGAYPRPLGEPAGD